LMFPDPEISVEQAKQDHIQTMPVDRIRHLYPRPLASFPPCLSSYSELPDKKDDDATNRASGSGQQEGSPGHFNLGGNLFSGLGTSDGSRVCQVLSCHQCLGRPVYQQSQDQLTISRAPTLCLDSPLANSAPASNSMVLIDHLLRHQSPPASSPSDPPQEHQEQVSRTPTPGSPTVSRGSSPERSLSPPKSPQVLNTTRYWDTPKSFCDALYAWAEDEPDALGPTQVLQMLFSAPESRQRRRFKVEEASLRRLLSGYRWVSPRQWVSCIFFLLFFS
jgi:hypothetical protein